jgi:predicted RNA-binding Zn-ribbon protein involved in translation (DUF1610 family)
MKRSLKCPKCGGVRIWIIEAFRIPSETAEGVTLPVVVHQEESAPKTLFGIARMSPRGRFDLYACDECGFSELYATDLGDVLPDEARGIRLVDASTAPKGPFR